MANIYSSDLLTIANDSTQWINKYDYLSLQQMLVAMSQMQAQLFLGQSRISHFMPALESLDFCVPSFPPVVWDWISEQDFSQVGAFVVFTGLVQLWAL